MTDAPSCPHCGAPRVAGPECPRCGVIYARAHQRDAPAAAPSAAPPVESQWSGAREDEALERKLRWFAVPIALVLARGCVATGPGHALGRIFFSMFLHELGHASAAWLCGHLAFPSLWVTPMSESRVVPFAVLFSLALAFGAYWAWRTERRGRAVLLGVLLAAQLGLTWGLSARSQATLICFAGDGGCFVYGSLLMATFFARTESALVRGWLRWGFLVIGACAFADTFATWFGALRDLDSIPFGEIEGVGLSDPSRLTEWYGWSVQAMVHRYLLLAALSLVGLGAAYWMGRLVP